MYRLKAHFPSGAPGAAAYGSAIRPIPRTPRGRRSFRVRPKVPRPLRVADPSGAPTLSVGQRPVHSAGSQILPKVPPKVPRPVRGALCGVHYAGSKIPVLCGAKCHALCGDADPAHCAGRSCACRAERGEAPRAVRSPARGFHLGESTPRLECAAALEPFTAAAAEGHHPQE